MNGTPTLCAWGRLYMFESLAPDGPERATDPQGAGLRQMCCVGTIAESVVIPGNAAVKYLMTYLFRSLQWSGVPSPQDSGQSFVE